MREAPKAVLYLARLTIEAESPLSVASGELGASDVALLRDASGLPMIAGASLEGLIKALAKRDGPAAKRLLGDENEASRVAFSDARIHDSKNESVSGLQLNVIVDPVLKALLSDDPIKRDHVKIDGSGAADAKALGKFDRTALPRGTRLSCELTMWGAGTDGDEAAFVELLALFRHPLFRPGGATVRGYGRVKVDGAWWRFDNPAGDADKIWAVRNAPYSERRGGYPFPAPRVTQVDQLEINLRSDALWRVGANGARTRTGEQHFGRGGATNRIDPSDVAPMREVSIRWSNGEGEWRIPGADLAGDFVLPGSAVRGALWHRSLFHWNLAHQRLIDADEPDAERRLEDALQMPAPLLALFGDVKRETSGWKSALIVDDIVFQPSATEAIDHVSIDRFSGGSRRSVLFDEELVHCKGPLPPIRITIDRKRLVSDRVDASEADKAIAALRAAIDDLCHERLALGAKSSGYFTGSIETVGEAA